MPAKLRKFLSAAYICVGIYFLICAVFTALVAISCKFKMPLVMIFVLYLPFLIPAWLFNSEFVIFIGFIAGFLFYLAFALYVLLPRIGFRTYVATHAAAIILYIAFMAYLLYYDSPLPEIILRMALFATLFCANEIRLIVRAIKRRATHEDALS